MDAKSKEWQAEKGVVAIEVEKDQLESDNTEKPPSPTHEELKEMFGFTNLSVHHSN